MSGPAYSLKDRGTQVAVWKNERGNRTITIKKTYKDKASNEWKESKQFFPEELTPLIKLLEQVRAYCEMRDEPEPVAAKVKIDDDEVPF